ncbi:MAG: dienelactone hydrolase family protein [Isosphaeraceae bacterium]
MRQDPPPKRPDWLDEPYRPAAPPPPGDPAPAPLTIDDQHRPLSAESWTAERRSTLEKLWKEFLGEITRRTAPPRVEVLETEGVEGIRRSRIRYESEPGLPVEAYLLRPDGPGSGRPAAVVLHSTIAYTIRQPAGLEGPEDKWIGLHLAKRGYVAICPRCFLWEYGSPDDLAKAVDWLKARHPHVKGMAKMLHDARVALDIVADQPDVDPGRIGTIGHSLGAKEALYLSAFDPRVKAAIFSEGGIGLNLSNWEAPWYLGDTIRRPGFGLDHAQILALSAPRPFLIIGGESADGDRSWPYVEAARPLWELLGSPDSVALFNHRRGHAYPPEARARAEQWLDWFLRKTPEAASRAGPNQRI